MIAITLILIWMIGAVLTALAIGSVTMLGGGADIVRRAKDMGGNIGGFAGAGTSGAIVLGPGPVITRAPAYTDYVDTIGREGDVSAVDTWTALATWGGSTEGDQSVPSDARFITKIAVAVGFDVLSATASYRAMSLFRLSGNGLKNGGLYRFIGPSGQTTAPATNNEWMMSTPVKVYPCRIPVKPGNQIKIEGLMIGEDCGDFTMAVFLTYSKSDPGVGIVDADVREVDLSALDTLVSVTGVGSETAGNIKIPIEADRILAIQTECAYDFGTSAGTFRGITVLQILGNGLVSGGMYRWPTSGVSFSALGTPAGGGAASGNIGFMDPVNIAVRGGNELILQAMMIGEDPGDATVAVGILYG